MSRNPPTRFHAPHSRLINVYGILVPVRSEVGQAILPADWLSSQSSRLKGGSGQD
jgi:hypothetical protein